MCLDAVLYTHASNKAGHKIGNKKMITVSLNEIRKQSPCARGWAKAQKSKGGTSADMDAQFPMSDILDSNDLDDTLWALRCRPEMSNLWRKFAVWAARQVESQMTDERSRAALDVAWRHSDGLATDEELAAARSQAWDAAWDAAASHAWDAARDAAWEAAGDAAGDARDAARAAQKAKLIEILAAGEWVN